MLIFVHEACEQVSAVSSHDAFLVQNRQQYFYYFCCLPVDLSLCQESVQ